MYLLKRKPITPPKLLKDNDLLRFKIKILLDTDKFASFLLFGIQILEEPW